MKIRGWLCVFCVACVGLSSLLAEQPKLLETLEARCLRMHAQQTAVLRETRRLHDLIESNAARKLPPGERAATLKLAADQTEIVNEATRAIALLEAEGAAVAFPEVFHQLREDMQRVRQALENGNVSRKILAIEQDIVDTLDEMTKALTKPRCCR